MDNAVSKLVEAANGIRSQEYRTDAIETAKQAREVQVAYSDISNLWSQRLNLQVEALQDIIADSGQIKGTASFLAGSQRVRVFSAEIDAAGKRVASGSNGLVYPSVRRPGSQCLACFRPALVYLPRKSERLQITFTANLTGYHHHVSRSST